MQLLEEEEQMSREDDEQLKRWREESRNYYSNFKFGAINSGPYAISSGSIPRNNTIGDRGPCNYSNDYQLYVGQSSGGIDWFDERRPYTGKPIKIEGAKVKNANENVGGHKLATQTALQHHNSAPTNAKQVSEATTTTELLKKEAAKVKNPNEKEGVHKTAETALQHLNSTPTNEKQVSEAAHDIRAAEAAKAKKPNKIEEGHKDTQTNLQHHNFVPTNGKQVHDIGAATELLKKEGAAKVKMPNEKEGEHKLATQTHNYGQTGLNTDYKLSVARNFDELNRKIERLQVPASTHTTQIYHAEYVTFIQGDWVRQSNDDYEFHLHSITDGRKRPGTDRKD